jgi:sn-glycerol 3-phosphate transport system permease protein
MRSNNSHAMTTAINRDAQPSKKKLITILKPYLFLLPITIFTIIFSYYPFIKTFVFSLCKINAKGEISKFVGLDNYIDILQRPDFQNSILISLKFVVLFVPFAVLIPFLLALIANRPKFLTKFYQTCYALPMAVSMSATCLIFEQLLHRRVGIFNYLLDKVGFYDNMTAIDWLNSKTWALPAIALVMLWAGLGFNFMLLLAAVRNVSSELLEAASLEGASYWRKVFTIVIPSVSPTLFFVFCTQMIRGLTMTGPVMILTKGGPLSSTSTMIYYVYTTGFRSGNYTLGSTASICAFIITFIFLLLNFMYEKRGVNYD